MENIAPETMTEEVKTGISEINELESVEKPYTYATFGIFSQTSFR